MAMTSAQWNKIQKSLPPEDRTSYADYLASQGIGSPTTDVYNTGGESTPVAPAPAGEENVYVSGYTSPAPTAPAAPAATLDPLKNKTIQPTAPAGYHYTWIGGTTTGSWILYKDSAGAAGGGAAGGAMGGATAGNTTSGTSAADAAVIVDMQNKINDLQAKLVEQGTNKKEAARAATTSALDDFRSSLRLAGLEALVDTLDGYIKDDLTPAQIRINITQSKAYQQRFPGMPALQKAGKAVNEATYISMERGMIGVLKAYGLDDKILGTTEKLGEVIGNLVSPTEYENRVQIASERVKANSDVLSALNEYFGVDAAGAMSYLLDPKTGMDIVKKQVRTAEIGAAAQKAQFDLSGAEAESYITATGTADLNTLKESFGKARLLANTQTRLAAIEGQKYADMEAVAAVLGSDFQRQLESQKRAARETARFAGGTGLTGSSLRSESLI